ncbi:hypothetical protein FEM03_15125 [Phragmitibacter flavus]|uniref:histidine kinase n=1 Tax=Phragmitibacter flavus TaxID=2576071 RepID=A0A5R8KCN0_9BACT|nr:ATP-binding protein [Phragmitibacter flavus]TLD70058.1 hypothetical protein FEM03_15125 [Phragmitibacter flavus]
MARQKRDEEVFLQHSQRRGEMLHRLVDGIDDGLFIVGNDQQILFANRGVLRFFPSIADPVGRPFLECVRDHRIAEVVANGARSGRRLREELLVSMPGDSMGGERVYSVEAVPLSSNEPAGLDGAVLVILRDETQKHHLEKIRKDFVANASHELRTPLSIIIGYLENLKEGDITDPVEIQRAFTLMKKHGDRLASIVEDLLVISRMESGQTEALRLEVFNFDACAQDVVHRLSPMVANSKSRASFKVDTGEDPSVFGDRFYWDQILFNLVGNAIKENQGGGVKIVVRLRQEPEFSVIEVRDDGVGIPLADLPFVFKRFYRVARHHSQEIKGTGLGLSIVKRAVEAHHGTISVHSKPGVETVFTIRVPRKGS